MGYRTVVILNNDINWQDNASLGKAINDAAIKTLRSNTTTFFDAGSVVQVAHCDDQVLGVFDSLNFSEMGRQRWYQTSDKERNLSMLKKAAEEMGYVLRKKAKQKFL